MDRGDRIPSSRQSIVERMSDTEFFAYVDQIMGTKDREMVVNLLCEFREKAYLSGRHMLIDAVRCTLNNFDDRAKFSGALAGYPWLPCPICKGVEGCDHSVTERARAAHPSFISTVHS